MSNDKPNESVMKAAEGSQAIAAGEYIWEAIVDEELQPKLNLLPEQIAFIFEEHTNLSAKEAALRELIRTSYTLKIVLARTLTQLAKTPNSVTYEALDNALAAQTTARTRAKKAMEL